MPVVSLADGDLNYLLEGPAAAPVLVLSNSLGTNLHMCCLLYTSPSPRDKRQSRMPSSA